MAASPFDGDAGVLIGGELAQLALGAGAREAGELGIVADVHVVVLAQELMGTFQALALGGVVDGDAPSTFAVGTLEFLVAEVDLDVVEELLVLAEVQVVELDVARIGFAGLARRAFRHGILLHGELLAPLVLQAHTQAESADAGNAYRVALAQQQRQLVGHVGEHALNDALAEAASVGYHFDEFLARVVTAGVQAIDGARLVHVEGVALLHLVVFQHRVVMKWRVVLK